MHTPEYHEYKRRDKGEWGRETQLTANTASVAKLADNLKGKKERKYIVVV